MNARQVSRRSFLGQSALAAAAAALVQAPEFLADGAWFETARAAGADLLHDTYNGLLAFVVPGRDEYSIQQGVVTGNPGGVEAGGVDALIATIDESTPQMPNSITWKGFEDDIENSTECTVADRLGDRVTCGRRRFGAVPCCLSDRAGADGILRSRVHRVRDRWHWRSHPPRQDRDRRPVSGHRAIRAADGNVHSDGGEWRHDHDRICGHGAFRRSKSDGSGQLPRCMERDCRNRTFRWSKRIRRLQRHCGGPVGRAASDRSAQSSTGE